MQKDQKERNKRIVELLNVWMRDDPDEQRQSFQRLKTALKQNRLSERQAFPDE